jgi:RNA polymerase sigma-54 factor
MALELRQQLKLTQQLVMTPQLQQAIRLLQLSRLELLETVQNELLENPFLEEAQEEHPSDSDEKRPEAEDDTGYEQELTRNADWEDYLGEFASTPRLAQLREHESFDDITPFEARYSSKPSLEGHLLWQLRLSSLTDARKDIGEIIIGNLSSTGYLQATLEEMAEMAGSSSEEVLRVLEIVQQFDPVGVAARTPQECLLVQLKVLRYDRDPILVELVREHLEDLEERRYKPLLRKFKLDMEELKEYMDVIQSLDPLPGASFGSGESA